MGSVLTSVALASALGVPVGASPWARRRVALFYWWRHGRWPDLDAPRRFTEWVQWRKLYDRRHGLALLTDKAHAKTIAEARIGAEHVIPTLFLGPVLPALAPWPMPFIVKANHGCGHYLVVRSAADYARARAITPLWLARPYGGILDEWHYRAARRLLLVEPYIGGETLPLDYKVYVFGGRAEVVQLHVGRGGRHRWTQFDRDWRALSDDPIEAEAPPRLGDLLAAAEAMAGAEDFLRVDFYCEDGRLSFGELCLYPGSGLDPFGPDRLDVALGERWSAAHSGRSAKHLTHQLVNQIDRLQRPDHHLERRDALAVVGHANDVDTVDRDALDHRLEFEHRATVAGPFADVAEVRTA